MRISMKWTEGRMERSTEEEIPDDITWDELQEHVVSLLRKAYKYSNEKIPDGLDIME